MPLYLIEILHQTTTFSKLRAAAPRLYLIEILHQTTTPAFALMALCSCILSKFYIKPQLDILHFHADSRCILSKFYIKPQLGRQRPDFRCVVSYRNSTSNHNLWTKKSAAEIVVSYRNSTSNHNSFCCVPIFYLLYLIEILHQTTTSGLILIDKVLLTGCLPL